MRDLSGQVEDVVGIENRRYCDGLVSDIADDHLGCGAVDVCTRAALARLERVDHDHPRARCVESVDQVRSNEAEPARDQAGRAVEGGGEWPRLALRKRLHMAP